jgi:molybdopterin-containing oxidoreductase family membrane subunit
VDGAAALMLTIHPLQERRSLLSIACLLAIVGLWIEKGMGLVVPGFVPTPLGEVFEYTLGRSVRLAGNLGAGMLIFTLLAKVAIPIELGDLRRAEPAPAPIRPPA